MGSSPRRAGFGALAALVAMMAVAPASAHHGWAGYQDEEFEVSGVVEQMSFASPHATMRIKAKDGKVWDLTLSPPQQTQSAGLTAGIIPIGATVKAHGHRHKDPKRLEVKTERVSWNDKTFNVYPNRS